MLWVLQVFLNKEAEVQLCNKNFHVIYLSCYTRVLSFLFLEYNVAYKKYHLNDNGEIKIMAMD